MEVDFSDPHSQFGVFEKEGLLRLWAPNNDTLPVRIKGEVQHASSVAKGVFEIELSEGLTFTDYDVDFGGGWMLDSYAFAPSITEEEVQLFKQGIHPNLHQFLGGRLHTQQGVEGVRFVIWAPHAIGVSVIGPFNGWIEKTHNLRKIDQVWEIFLPNLKEGVPYQFIIETPDKILKKADPFALYSAHRPKRDSIIAPTSSFVWEDGSFMERSFDLKDPMHIYEVHLGDWITEEVNYKKIAPALSAYCKEHHFNYVELMPLHEHPLDESWGYQVTGLFSLTSRYGSIEEFKYLVNYLHKEGIGVILDFVIGHFPKDDFGLYQFDGTSLFEDKDPLKKHQPKWGTMVFDYGSLPVQNMLISAAFYWLEEFHIDGLRLDAVDSMLHLDFGRKDDQWQPNELGTNHHLEAIAFLKRFTKEIKTRSPRSVLIAEDSSGFPKVTFPVEQGGLGFDLKWNLGFAFDTFEFIKTKNDHWLTLSMQYHFDANYLLPLSHDELAEVSLYELCSGSRQKRFEQMQTYFALYYTHPGKKLLFMGYEKGVTQPWCFGVPMSLKGDPLEKALNNTIKELASLYCECEALHSTDYDPSSFQWIEVGVNAIGFIRTGSQERVFCVHNFSSEALRISLPHPNMESIFSTDKTTFSGKIEPLSSRIFKGPVLR